MTKKRTAKRTAAVGSSVRCNPVVPSLSELHFEMIDKRLASIEKRMGQVVHAVEDRLHKLDVNVDARADADMQRTVSRRDADTVHDASYAAADAKHASRPPNGHALDCDLAFPCSCGALRST